jgi:hypothetical protein
VNQRQHHRRPLGSGTEEELSQASRVGLEPQSAQFRPSECQFERLFVAQPEDRRWLQRDDANRHRFADRADHHPELLPALDHPEQRLRTVGGDPEGLEPPSQFEPDRGEHDVRLVDDAACWVLRDSSETHDFVEGLIRRTLKVCVHFQ